METKSNLPYVADDPAHRVKCIMECVRQAKLAVLFLSNTQGPLKCGLLVWLIWLMKCGQRGWVSLTGGGSESPEDVCFVLLHPDDGWGFSQQQFNQPTSSDENDDSSEHSPCRSRRAHSVRKEEPICVRESLRALGGGLSAQPHSASPSSVSPTYRIQCRDKFYHGGGVLGMCKNMGIKNHIY